MRVHFEESKIFSLEFFDEFSFGKEINKTSDDFVISQNSVFILGFETIVADAIRSELYKTSYSFQNLNITDIGNLKNTNIESLQEVILKFRNQKCNLIILGLNSDKILDLLKFWNDSFSNVAFIEKKGDIFFNHDIRNYLDNSININKSKLLCYQTHLLHNKHLEGLKVNQSMRLGEFRNDFRAIEPLLRDADFTFFNLDSIRYSEIPGIKNTTPSGLTSEEACQIMKYVGLNSKYNKIGFIGYDSKFDFHNQGAMLISQMIWYYLEGLDQKVNEDIENSGSVQYFMVEMSDYNLTLKFIQSKKTGRWWVEIPSEHENQNYILPCSEEDFLKASNNELTYRVFSELSV